MIDVDAPETVEVVLWAGKDDSLMVHVINRTAGGPHRTRSSVINHPIPVSNIKIKLVDKFSTAVWQPSGVNIDVLQENNFSVVEIPPLEIYGILKLDK